MPTQVVHCKRKAFDVYIGRPSKWGNPFVIGKDGTREQVISQYRTWVIAQPVLMDSLSEIKGKTLGCWCSPHPCHGDILAELANGLNLEENP
jgi:hypothetical protein